MATEIIKVNHPQHGAVEAFQWNPDDKEIMLPSWLPSNLRNQAGRVMEVFGPLGTMFADAGAFIVRLGNGQLRTLKEEDFHEQFLSHPDAEEQDSEVLKAEGHDKRMEDPDAQAAKEPVNPAAPGQSQPRERENYAANTGTAEQSTAPAQQAVGNTEPATTTASDTAGNNDQDKAVATQTNTNEERQETQGNKPSLQQMLARNRGNKETNE